MFQKSVIAILLAFLLGACGGTTPYQAKEFNLNMELPSGWKGGKDTYGSQLTVELYNDDLRMLQITQANPTVDNLDMLEKACEAISYEVLSKENITNGFGVTVQAEGKKQFLYYITKDGKQYKLEPAPYYEESGFEECMQIIKTVK